MRSPDITGSYNTAKLLFLTVHNFSACTILKVSISFVSPTFPVI